MTDGYLNKKELSELLHRLEIPVDEGITSINDTNRMPRVVYWPFAEQELIASGEGYCNLVTYQISFYADVPGHEKFNELRGLLREKEIRPLFNHEFVEKDPVFARTWHTYCAVDVLDKVEE